MSQAWLWICFHVLVLALLSFDLLVFHRKAHEVRLREAAAWSAVWIGVSLLFNYGVYRYFGPESGLEFLTGYLIQKALSVDNIFVFVLIFSYFRVPAEYQHRVLFWGILGALVMRGTMIGAGVVLIREFHWIIYVFGAFLMVTGFRMATHDEQEIHPAANPVLRVIRRFLPVTDTYRGQRFFVRASVGPRVRRVATPLFVVLALVETTDLVFAVDSIPAIFAITQDLFIVYTSNIFAILGLRALYFVLAGIIHKFHYLKLGLSVVLVFVGAKMLASEVYPIPIGLSLGVVAAVIGASVGASLLWPSRGELARPVEPGPMAVGGPGDPGAPPGPEPPGGADDPPGTAMRTGLGA